MRGDSPPWAYTKSDDACNHCIVNLICSAKAYEIVLGSCSMQTVNSKSGEPLGGNVSSTREKEKNGNKGGLT